MGAAMSAPTCPHCGAERSARKSVAEFECGTAYFFECGTACFGDGAHVRDFDCYQRQLAQKDEEIQRVLAANKDCIAWFEDGRDEAIKLNAEFNEALEALRNLVNDSQHKDHDCGDTPEHCPVLAARAIVKKYGKR